MISGPQIITMAQLTNENLIGDTDMVGMKKRMKAGGTAKKKRAKAMGGGVMKKRMKAGGTAKKKRAKAMGGGVMKKRMKRGGRA